MLWAQAKGFYRPADSGGEPHTEYFDLAASTYATIEPRPGITVLADVKRARGVVDSNPGASLIDLGDGVLCCEFHSKMNSVGGDVSRMLRAGLAQLETNFEAMIVANQGVTFCAGADLMMILLTAQDEEWDDLNALVNDFQQLNMSLKYAPKPVVAAPFNMALGGGCEIPLHCARIQASAELYMGMVEVSVGVIPAGGGCKEMVLRTRDVKKIFEQIGFAKVSGSAAEARDFRYLRDGDRISMNPERLIDDAKHLALSLVSGYAPGAPRTDITVSGEAGYALMQMGVWMARQGGYISDYDAVIGEKLAYILSGGKLSGTPQVSEQYLLDLEREMFLSLCGRQETAPQLIIGMSQLFQLRRVAIGLIACLTLSAATVITHPFEGVTYIDRTETLPRAIHMHIVQVDLNAPGLRFKLTPPSGKLETTRQTTLVFLNEEHAQVAINAHFFTPFPSPDTEASVIGLAASDGNVYSGFESPLQNYALVANAPALNIDSANHAGIVHRDPAAGDENHAIEKVTLWTALAGSAQIVTNGAKTIPAYADSAHPEALLTPGGPNNYSNEKSWYDVLQARTAIGLSRGNRTLILFTVDVRGGSAGLKVGEVADILRRDYAVWNALNLDGGGSTTMAIEDPVSHAGAIVNTSSDNPAGRSVASSLAVFARRSTVQ
jgi:enoyl-CoA hydratase/carnithine racemase/exopolysaccharide biosynthesis protein